MAPVVLILLLLFAISLSINVIIAFIILNRIFLLSIHNKKVNIQKNTPQRVKIEGIELLDIPKIESGRSTSIISIYYLFSIILVLTLSVQIVLLYFSRPYLSLSVGIIS